MKSSHIFLVTGILLSLSSCSKNKFDPYIPTEWQYEKYSNSSILPGDDFYRFVCGKGIESEGSDSWAPFSRWEKQQSDYTVEAFASMRERLDNIKKDDGSIDDWYQLFDVTPERKFYLAPERWVYLW